MQLGDAGARLILDYEKFRDTSYLDAKGVWTIGYGTTFIDGVPVTEGMTCTKEQALGWFRHDCDRFVARIAKLVTVPLSQNQLDAFVSFVYNVGDSGFAKSSLLQSINAKRSVTEDLFTRWNKVRMPTGEFVVLDGLTRRRRAEYRLFTTP